MTKQYIMTPSDTRVLMGAILANSYVTSPVFSSMSGVAVAGAYDEQAKLYTDGLASCFAVAVVSRSRLNKKMRRLIYLPGG